MPNTGYKSYTTLEQYNIGTGVATGITKPNVSGDPDYVAPVFDPVACPPPTDPEVDLNKIHLTIINEGTQFIRFDALVVKPWNAEELSQYYYNDVFFSLPGQIQNYISPSIQQIGDWFNISINAGAFSKGWQITLSMYFTNSDGRTLRQQLQVDPNSGLTQNLISIPRTAAGGDNLLEIIITDIPGSEPPPNIPPTANAGTDQTITLPANSVQLSGSGTDPDGTIIGYQWQRISGPLTYNISNPLIANPIISNLVAGVYIFRLTVTDNKGAIDQDTVTITVNSSGNDPDGVVVVLVDSALPGSSISQIKIDGTNLLSTPVTSATSPKAIVFPKGTYFNIEVITTGAGGSLRINQGTTPMICQPYQAAGSYVFHNLTVDEGVNGLTISLTAAACSDTGPTVYAKLVTSNIQTVEEATAPWGKRVMSTATIEVKFYSDSGGTTPVNASLILNYRITTTDNLASSTSYEDLYTGVTSQNSILIGGNLSLQEWDYTENDPDVAEDPGDKIIDETYVYSLLPGIGYIVI